MRLEATVPESRGNAVTELATQLGLSKSQIIDEALSLFLKAVMEIQRGRQLVTRTRDDEHSSVELTTPTLTALEWALAPDRLDLSETEFTKLKELIRSAPEPSERLKVAARRRADD